jgi:2-isopropylmalate synthase
MFSNLEKGFQMAKIRKIKIFDTTLRDGEQSPGATLMFQEKMKIANQLAKLNVDIIEAGFPIASPDDFKAVHAIASEVKGPIIAALSRAKKADIDIAAKAIEPAKKSRIHTFLATSPIHMKYKLKMNEKEVLENIGIWVRHAKDYCDDVEFSPEDAARSEKEFLFKAVETAVNAGATTINIPDTVGYAQPFEFGAMIKGIVENVPGIENAIVSVHCHDDLGLAVANSLEGIKNGAGQVEGTINGIGERAGNASLEEVIMSLKMRQKYYGAATGIKFKEIYATSKMVSDFTGIVVQPNKAIVGRNAFAHEAGIHQHGVLQHKQTYEIMDAKMIGKESVLVIGKHSGRAAIHDFLKKKGYKLSQRQLLEVTTKIKELADKQKKVFEDDIIAIAENTTNELAEKEQIVKLEEVFIITGNKTKPTAKVKLSFDGRQRAGSGEGVGPVDAVSKAINSVAGDSVKLLEYDLKAITGGTDALADVTVKVQDKNKNVFTAESINEDIVMASAEAFVKALNKALVFGRRKK